MNFFSRLAAGRVNRVAFLLLAILIVTFTATLMNTLTIRSDKDLLLAVAPGLIGGGLCLHALRITDIGWHWLYAVPTVLVRAGWLYALGQINFYRSDGWFETALGLLVLDLLLVIALAVWPGRRGVVVSAARVV